MESYHKRKKVLEEKYGKLINIKLYGDKPLADNKQQNYIKKIKNISDEEGLRRAYQEKDGLYQHYNKIFIAGAKMFHKTI